MKTGDRYWFPPTEFYPNGILLTVDKLQTMHPYGMCVWWTDGTWTRLDLPHGSFKVTEEFLTDLWTRAGET